jgi:tetratricopeptide (TPR) repeat protein
MGLALSNVYVDDANGVKSAVDKLVADFHDRTDLPTALFQIGAGYYKQALVRLKDPSSFPSAKEYFLRAQGLWKRIIQEFPERKPSDTADAHYFSGVCCRYLGEYLDAITHYRTVVDNWPGYPYAWNAQFLIGYCYKQLSVLGAVSESVAHAQIKAAYEQVVQKYPDCPAAAAARDWLKNN